MSSYGCFMVSGPHSFSHNAFQLWAAKSYRHACACESGAGTGPIEVNMGEGWMPLGAISNTTFEVRVRYHPTNSEVAFKVMYKNGTEWKGLVQGKLEGKPSVSMMVKRMVMVVAAYMKKFPGKPVEEEDVELLCVEDGEMDMRPDMSCAVEEILLIERSRSDAVLLVDFIEALIDCADYM